MIQNQNIILASDSYKASHPFQYPHGTDGYYGYIESRGCNKHWDKTFIGKESKAGRLVTKKNGSNYITVREELDEYKDLDSVLEPVYKDGVLLKRYNFEEVRAKSN